MEAKEEKGEEKQEEEVKIKEILEKRKRKYRPILVGSKILWYSLTVIGIVLLLKGLSQKQIIWITWGGNFIGIFLLIWWLGLKKTDESEVRVVNWLGNTFYDILAPGKRKWYPPILFSLGIPISIRIQEIALFTGAKKEGIWLDIIGGGVKLVQPTLWVEPVFTAEGIYRMLFKVGQWSSYVREITENNFKNVINSLDPYGVMRAQNKGWWEVIKETTAFASLSGLEQYSWLKLQEKTMKWYKAKEEEKKEYELTPDEEKTFEQIEGKLEKFKKETKLEEDIADVGIKVKGITVSSYEWSEAIGEYFKAMMDKDIEKVKIEIAELGAKQRGGHYADMFWEIVERLEKKGYERPKAEQFAQHMVEYHRGTSTGSIFDFRGGAQGPESEVARWLTLGKSVLDRMPSIKKEERKSGVEK